MGGWRTARTETGAAGRAAAEKGVVVEERPGIVAGPAETVEAVMPLVAAQPPFVAALTPNVAARAGQVQLLAAQQEKVRGPFDGPQMLVPCPIYL